MPGGAAVVAGPARPPAATTLVVAQQQLTGPARLSATVISLVVGPARLMAQIGRMAVVLCLLPCAEYVCVDSPPDFLSEKTYCYYCTLKKMN
jgi:hypothetical protein